MVLTASSKENKLMRLIDMLYTVFTKASRVSVVLLDTYSTQNFYYAVAVGNLCRLLRKPYIPILHGGNLPNRLKRSPSQAKKLFHGAKMNVAPSLYLMEAFQKEGINNLVHIPNSIEIKDYPFLLRKEIKPRLLWVRSFAEIYNPMLALQTLKLLKSKYPEASLTMVGPDKDGSLQKCKDYSDQNNLGVEFTGKLTKAEWIKISAENDIFINTTNFDNMPVSVIEAMALGLPVVSTNVGGLPFLINHDNDGVIVEPNDPELFEKAIINLLQNPQKGEYLSNNARKKAESYSWDQIKHLWLDLLRE